MTYCRNKHFNFLLFVITLDFFTDGISYTLKLNLAAGDPFIKIFIIINFFILYLFGIKSYPIKLNLKWTPFYLVSIVFFYGFLRGLLTNRWIDVFNDTSSYIALFLVLVVYNLNKINLANSINKYFKYLIIILAIKLIIFQILSIVVVGIPSWKMLLKQHAFLLIPFSVYSYDYLKKGKVNFFLFLLTIFLLILAVARMLFISMFFIFLINLFRSGIFRSFFKFFIIILFIIILFKIFLITQSVEQSAILDILYGGEIYQGGLDYRYDQLEIIIIRFISNPLSGMGFGYFTPNYLTYGELAKPYLLELDLLNFISKIGFFFSILYFCSYLILLVLIFKLQSPSKRNL